MIMVNKQRFANGFRWNCGTSFSYLLFFLFFSLVMFPHKYRAQNATTDPLEVRALNTIFKKWNVKANSMWNISGEPCSGSAINDTIDVEHKDNNPSIKCNCTFNGNATCHITHLRVQSLDAHGEIPKEITTFKHLIYLKIDLNYFTGTLPAFLGNLSALEILSVSHNDFYGTIPKELGNLKNLFMIALGSNNFTGTLPPELGNLENLALVYIDSCGLSGELPKTFSKLQKMRVLYTTDSLFSGKIPEFIGNWKDLSELRLQGNSFEGPIPSSFSRLTSLTSLRISDIYNGSSSNLNFVRNLTNLKELIIRNAMISDELPSYIEKLQHLEKLDLSFNNLTGDVPSSFFMMPNLTYLILGNNSLTGTLPNQLNEKLENIDLSYNYLSGRLPAWVSSLSQLNLVANNFLFDSSNNTLLAGLECLQRNFPCNRDKPLYANFSIKCGGPEFKGKSGIVYETEEMFLGPARFYVTDNRWAVSKVGLFADRTGKLDIEGTRAEVSGSREGPELFHTARMCPGSLRYYGLGLVNGNYTVTLHFAEIGFPNRNSQKWAGLARRIFDIYIQGVLKQKNFEIAAEAGGVERAIEKKFSVVITENYLEIHLFWAGKGTCCIPKEGYFGPLIGALHAASDFTPNFLGTRKHVQKRENTGLIVGVAVSITFVCLLLLASVYYFYYIRKADNEDDEVILGLGSKVNVYTFSELRAATEDFKISNKIGEGGFGSVYKGTLSDGNVVAVKQLSVASHHGRSQFLAEIETISVVQHRNLVKLHGCCVEGDRRILAYEYLENRSLDQALFEKSEIHLDWATRFSICLGTARGLAYLHEESSPKIIHRDVKASNILLDTMLCPKISDFGLAKLYDDTKTHVSTRVAGTLGYLAPEYALRGHLTEKADVFGFGVVALEVISGRPNFCNSLSDEKKYILEWAWTLHENDNELELVDEKLMGFDENEAIRLIRIALLCTQASPWLRPPMSRVVGMITGDIEVDSACSRPSYLTDLNFKDSESSLFSTETADISLDSSNPNSRSM